MQISEVVLPTSKELPIKGFLGSSKIAGELLFAGESNGKKWYHFIYRGGNIGPVMDEADTVKYFST